ncbi:retrovirus-related Pol polyprotein from transposon 297 [Trichonephila clavipes]|nr:retrovirus-related Pol polyprotein from transposon 297 [Trichonephila clavipes]
MRLCIDYRKFNTQTVPDSYLLPRMDDFLNEAKLTPYMSTIDLRSGYHQVKVAAENRDKTAFTCPFGIYKFIRIPFGLRNAPATFQRLIYKFRSGLNNVLALLYLDDIIILSPTFQKHLSDPEQVFKCLSLFKLNANREKCNFCCKKVKYLGHITLLRKASQLIHKRQLLSQICHPQPLLNKYKALYKPVPGIGDTFQTFLKLQNH